MVKNTLWKKALGFALPLFLGGTFAGRLDEVAQRKGFHPNAVRDMEKHIRGLDKEKRDARRYYNSKTKDYFVESLPDVPANYLSEMYSGTVPVYGSTDRELFFVFQPRIGDPVDEVTIWLNGGPGCSSLEGFLQENGYIQWTWGQYSPQVNEYSWVKLTNMLWVEQPVGVGFSTGTVNSTSEEDIAADFVSFFKNWENIFGIKNYKIYVTGESYAGRYVPYIAAAMLDEKDPEYYDVNGALVYDPCIGAFDVQDDMNIYPFIEANNNVLGYNDTLIEKFAELDEKCGYAKFREEYLVYPPSGTQPTLPESTGECAMWNTAYYAAYAQNPCFNVYEIGFTCPLLADPLGYPTDLQYNYPGLPTYFNRTDVKKAMHAPLDVEWSECNANPFVGKEEGGFTGPEGYNDLSADPILAVLPQVIEATNRVLIANGQLDMDILTNSTLLAIQNMTWNGAMGFQSCPSEPIIISLPDLQYEATFASSGFPKYVDNWGQGYMGKQHYERGLLFAETALSGHMEPQFQPRSAYRHMEWLLGRIDKL